jgi:hypothetical protein
MGMKTLLHARAGEGLRTPKAHGAFPRQIKYLAVALLALFASKVMAGVPELFVARERVLSRNGTDYHCTMTYSGLNVRLSVQRKASSPDEVRKVIDEVRSIDLAPSEVSDFVDVCEKFEEWKKIATEKHVETFSKKLGVLKTRAGTPQLDFDWEAGRAALSTRLGGHVVQFDGQEIASFADLLRNDLEAAKKELAERTAKKASEDELFK